jgi:hypothetical protein
MDQPLWLLSCLCIGFISGYLVREMISRRRRSEERRKWEERERKKLEAAEKVRRAF